MGYGSLKPQSLRGEPRGGRADARIGGNLECDDASSSGTRRPAGVSCGSTCRILTLFYFSTNFPTLPEFRSEGEVRLLGAKIGFLSGAMMENLRIFTEQQSNANSASIKGSIYFGSGFQAEGTVELVNAEVTISVSCARGKLSTEEGKALNLDGLRTGDVFLTNGFAAKGEVRLVGAKINGQLVCSGGSFRNAKGRALNLASATVGDSVMLSNRFEAEGEISLAAAKVGGDVRLTYANLSSGAETTLLTPKV